MKTYDITFKSINSIFYAKPLTMLVVEPDHLNEQTGAMLFTHGWGANRFKHHDLMHYASQTCNLVCLSVEFRQSGYDFDPITGAGACNPYDASFFQVFDVLNGLRTLLELRPTLNHQRLFHYGASQGGHIALLSAIFAPRTFAFVYASSAITHMDEDRQMWAGREFAPHELAIRSVLDHVERIRCPLLIDHGTADPTVPVQHTRLLETKLINLCTTHEAMYYENGGHNLEPAISRLNAFKTVATDFLMRLALTSIDDFTSGAQINIPCGEKILHIDWSKPADHFHLFEWRNSNDNTI